VYWDELTRAATLLVVLLNPFLMSIYLLDLFEALDTRTFMRVLLRGTAIATVVFALFAAFGDAIFTDVFQVRFASFLVFGGVVFVLIGIRFVQVGPAALSQLRGAPGHVAGSIAMPFMVGPGTISASILAGASMPIGWAVVAIALAMLTTVTALSLIKWLHGWVKVRHAPLVDRYIDVIGRASALLIGTIAVDMILNGVGLWLDGRS
jgi:small neutral amino acid transporter SnatA (MarC family)